MKRNLIIKNMVCPRCIESVQQVLGEMEVEVVNIQLGRVTTFKTISTNQKKILQTKLSEKGFELLDDKNTQLINEIKSIIIHEIHYQTEAAPINFSNLLADKLHYNYAYLSRLFSSVEGRTIERFILSQKIEKVKELLTYDELTLSEIAFQMHYSSSAHLSAQFRKRTGMSPSAFKKLQNQERQFLDEV
jgi:AraC-like DNA-binding protein